MPDELERAFVVAVERLGLPQCIGCNRISAPSRAGHSTFCLRCTEREIGIGAGENAARIAAGLSIAQWLKLDPNEPWPAPRDSVTKRRLHGVSFQGG